MRKSGKWTEEEVIEDILKVLKSLYPDTDRESRSRGPDISARVHGKVIFYVDCKKSQPRAQAGNQIPDRALGQMIRYHMAYSLPIFLVVPDDWTLRRKQGETGEPWKSQVERLLDSVNLQTEIRVLTISEIQSAGFGFETP